MMGMWPAMCSPVCVKDMCERFPWIYSTRVVKGGETEGTNPRDDHLLRENICSEFKTKRTYKHRIPKSFFRSVGSLVICVG